MLSCRKPRLPVLIDDLPTPALLIEKGRLLLNIDRMQARAATNAVQLRPHIKTHKSVALARLQRERGAHGLTAAKPSEAEVFVQAGFDDVRLAYTVVGESRHQQLLRLMDRATISFCVDTLEGARAASHFYAQAGRRVPVLIEVDTGYGRCGIRWDDAEAVAFAREIAALPGLSLMGLLTHEGQSYAGPRAGETKDDALIRAMAEGRDRLLALAGKLGAAGLAMPDDFQLSMGSTPSMRHFENRTEAGFRITEIRPGNYVFYDAMQASLGTCTLQDCALTVAATVVSKKRHDGRERLFLDAGKKTLTSDGGYGLTGYGVPLYNARAMRVLPHLHIFALSEEHAWCEVPGAATFEVGDRLRLVPNHACVTVATQEKLFLVEGDEVLETWAVDARDGMR